MKILKNMCWLFLIICLSCTGTIEKTWKISDFSKTHTFSIEVPMNKNVSNANVYLSGDYTGKIRLEYFGGHPVLEYKQDSLPQRLFIDFYGGEFKIRLLSSNAIGKLTINIEIPYGP